MPAKTLEWRRTPGHSRIGSRRSPNQALRPCCAADSHLWTLLASPLFRRGAVTIGRSGARRAGGVEPPHLFTESLEPKCNYPSLRRRRDIGSRGGDGNGYHTHARRNPLPRVGDLGAIGTCWQRRCGVPRVVARRLDVGMSFDEIGNPMAIPDRPPGFIPPGGCRISACDAQPDERQRHDPGKLIEAHGCLALAARVQHGAAARQVGDRRDRNAAHDTGTRAPRTNVEDACRAAEAKAAEDARRASEAKAADDARVSGRPARGTHSRKSGPTPGRGPGRCLCGFRRRRKSAAT
jgi:hypothetical protein